MGHTLRGCVDWNYVNDQIVDIETGHTLRGCVDWNTFENDYTTIMTSHPAWVCGLKLKRNTKRKLY